MLEARSLTKHYGYITAVRQVSFSIGAGEILGYLGPNGAGKSTTVKMLTGLIQPSEGQIFYNGRNIYNDLAGFQRLIGYVPEEAHLYPHLSGREYLQLVGRLRGMPRRILESKMDELLRLFSLWEHRFINPSSYSKGMRQKILLSAALMHNPEILILDEPSSGLDVTSALMLRGLLNGLARIGKIILYSSHVLEVVEKVCSQVLILRRATLRTIRATFEKTNSQQTIYGVQTLESIVFDSVASQRFTMILLGAFAVLAVLLASIGIYGVISYVVGQRTHEIGLRIALGANRSDVLRLVLGESAAMAIVGVTLGIGAAFGLTRLMAKMLYGVSAHDPFTFAGVAILLTAVALARPTLPRGAPCVSIRSSRFATNKAEQCELRLTGSVVVHLRLRFEASRPW